jgi:hypothetical protein
MNILRFPLLFKQPHMCDEIVRSKRNLQKEHGHSFYFALKTEPASFFVAFWNEVLFCTAYSDIVPHCDAIVFVVNWTNEGWNF